MVFYRECWSKITKDKAIHSAIPGGIFDLIRKLNKSDIDKIVQIWLETNIKAHDFIPEKYWRGQLDTVKSMLPQAEVYVYEDNRKIHGFIGIIDNYIAGIFVSVVAQSKGIGKQLLDYAKVVKTKLSLSVYQKNKRAIMFYQREYFTILAEKIDENTGEQEFLMQWQQEMRSKTG
jgi:putative acetyltransferase